MKSRSSQKNQSSIQNFFKSQPRKTSSSSTSCSKAVRTNTDEDIFVSQSNSISPHPTLENIRPKKTTVEWWKTPPKGLTGIKRSIERLSDQTPFEKRIDIAKRQSSASSESLSQPDSLSSQSSILTQNDSFSGGRSKYKPLARPGGKASSINTSSSQHSVMRSMLSNEQKTVLDLIVEERKNVFFTGAAGTGKSHLLRVIVEILRRGRVQTPDIAVTATTGLAAYSINGQTIHKWSGLGSGEGDPASYATKIGKFKALKDNWTRCRILIIDEISMLSPEFFDKLGTVAQIVRKNNQPFGGIQVVLTGDFYQLPPVYRPNGQSYNEASKNNPLFWKLCFDARSWPLVSIIKLF